MKKILTVLFVMLLAIVTVNANSEVVVEKTEIFKMRRFVENKSPHYYKINRLIFLY